MLLAMRRESEPHHAATTPTIPSTANAVDVTAVVSASSATQSNASVTTNGLVVPSVSSALQLSPSLSIAANATSCTTQYHHLQLQQQQQHAELQQHVEHLQQQQADSLNTPTTPLLNLGRSPLQFPPPPPPPVPVQAGPQFGFYTPNTGAATYLHPHYPHPSAVPTSAGTSLVSINTGNASLANSSSQRSSSVQSTELDEYVDILQVQQLLLDSSASASQQALAAANSGNTNGTTATPSPQQSLPKPRPRLNLQKATEYAAQVQAENQSSRRMLLDYPSPYLYGNHYHTSPSEDLVALWFGSNGSGIDLADQVASYFSPLRKTIRWFHKVAFDVLLNTAVINAYILYNENNPKMQISDFRQSIILFMSGKDSASIARSPPQGKHFLITSTEATKDGRRKRHRCGMCYSELKTTNSSSVARKKAKLVATYCAQCRRSPYLCLKHFQQLH